MKTKQLIFITAKRKIKKKVGYQPGERRKRPAIMYEIDRGRSPESPVFNLYINESELPKADDKGVIHLVGFKNNRKEKESHPDYNFSVARPRPEGNGGEQRPASQKPALRAPAKKKSEDYEF